MVSFLVAVTLSLLVGLNRVSSPPTLCQSWFELKVVYSFLGFVQGLVFGFTTVCLLEYPVVLRLRYLAISRVMSYCERWDQNLVRAAQTAQTDESAEAGRKELSWRPVLSEWLSLMMRYQTEPLKGDECVWFMV